MDNASGGSEHLPTQGAGPYGKLSLNIETPADEPYVVAVFRVSVRDPSALWRDDGGVRLWFGYEQDQSGLESELWYAELADIAELPDVAPRPALLADQSWEQGWVGAPSVVELAGGELVMFYQGGRDYPGIGRAVSNDHGATWSKYEGNPVLDGFMEPGVVVLSDQRWLLYATRPDEPGIFRADSTDGLSFAVREAPVLVPRPELEPAYDRQAVSDPFVVVRHTPAGRLHYGMFFNGTMGAGDEVTTSVGWAGSFDGLVWQRFSSPDQPVLAPEGTSEHGPSVLLEPDRGIMFFSELRQGVQSIAVAVHP